jgi:hypothetical protein
LLGYVLEEVSITEVMSSLLMLVIKKYSEFQSGISEVLVQIISEFEHHLHALMHKNPSPVISYYGRGKV